MAEQDLIAQDPAKQSTPSQPGTELAPGSLAGWASRITLALLIAGTGYLGLLVIRPFAGALLMGAVMAVAFYPLYQRLRGRMKHPSLATSFTLLVFLLAVLGPLAYVISIAVREMTEAIDSLGPGGVSEGANRVWESLQGPLNRVAGWFGSDASELQEAAAARLGNSSGTILGSGFLLIGGITATVINFFILLGAMYFGLLYGAGFHDQLVAYSPLGKRRTETLVVAAREMIEASVYGIAAVALAQGTLVALGTWISGLGTPVLWGVTGAVGSIIPVVGSAIAWLPAAAVLFIQGDTGWGVFMLIWGIVVVGASDNIVRPWIVSARRPLNPLLVLIVILGGVQAFGLMGLLIGPVTLAVMLALLRILKEEINPEAAARESGASRPAAKGTASRRESSQP